MRQTGAEVLLKVDSQQPSTVGSQRDRGLSLGTIHVG